MKQESGPDTPSSSYVAMAPLWDKIDAVLGGTESMRGRSTLYLPQHYRESQETYEERLSRAILINSTEQTLGGWVGRPFSKPMQRNPDIPDQFEDFLEDVDMLGNNLDVFCRQWFREGVAKGFSHVLVDFPDGTQGEDVVRTLADDRRDGLRPFLVHLPPENVIAAYSEVVGGRERLTHVRIREDVIERVGYDEVLHERVRVYEPGVVSLFEKRQTKGKRVEWVQIEEREYGLPYVPMVTYYSQREGFMLSKPPLLDLVNMNIAHWQSMSDQIAVLTVARFPMLAASGGLDGGGESGESEVIVGPKALLESRDPAGRVYYVEHSGKAIASGRTDLMDLEEKMAKYGAEYLTKKPGRQTATARSLDSAEATSPLQDMVHRFVDSVNLVLQYVADWSGLETGGTVDLNTDFGLSGQDTAALQTLLETSRNRDISREAFLRELQRYNVLDRSYDMEADEESIESENAFEGIPRTAPTDDVSDV